jgi:lysophospholipase L1-like esterase
MLERIHAFCRKRGVELVVIVPWYAGFEDHAPLLRRFAAEHGLAIVDLPRRLASLPGSRADYFVDLIHPNDEGHRRIAAAIVDVLLERWSFLRLADDAGSDGNSP